VFAVHTAQRSSGDGQVGPLETSVPQHSLFTERLFAEQAEGEKGGAAHTRQFVLEPRQGDGLMPVTLKRDYCGPGGAGGADAARTDEAHAAAWHDAGGGGGGGGGHSPGGRDDRGHHHISEAEAAGKGRGLALPSPDTPARITVSHTADGGWEPWVLELTAKQRNRLIEKLKLSHQDARALKATARMTKQRAAQRRCVPPARAESGRPRCVAGRSCAVPCRGDLAVRKFLRSAGSAMCTSV